MLLTFLCLWLACGPQAALAGFTVPGAAGADWSPTVIGYDADAAELVSVNGPTVSITGGGADIWDQQDQFTFLHTSMPGDGTLSARLTDFTTPDDDGKAGIMLRDGLEAGARNVLLYVTGSGGAMLQGRPGEDGATASSARSDSLDENTWLKLTRFGNTVIGYVSSDGGNWRELGRMDLSTGQGAVIGFAVTSRAGARTATAQFSDLKFVRGAAQAAPEGAPLATAPAQEALASSWVCGSQPLQPAFTPTLYVATTGDDEADGRSEEGALRTVQRAADLAAAGDVVWVRDGVYSANITFKGAGTQEAPIVFESYPGECAILDGSELERHQHLRFVGARHYVFRNFEVRNSPAQGIYLDESSDIHVTNVRSHHNGLSGIQNVGGSGNRFSRFIVHDNSDGTQGNADGIGITSGNDIVISQCVAFRNSDDGVDAWRSQGTTIEYCISFQNGFQGGDGNGFKAGGGLPDGDAVLRQNVSFSNKTQGFTFNSGGGITFHHNTAFDNGYSGFIAGRATLVANLASGNRKDDFWDEGDNQEIANSWNLELTDSPFVSTDPRSADFLTLTPTTTAVGAANTSSDYADLGAIPFGQTIRSVFGIDLDRLLDY